MDDPAVCHVQSQPKCLAAGSSIKLVVSASFSSRDHDFSSHTLIKMFRMDSLEFRKEISKIRPLQQVT